jgi:hypothetical protein
MGFSYVVRYDPRGILAKFIVPEEYNIEEYQQDVTEDQVDVLDKDVEEVEDVVDDVTRQSPIEEA